MLWAAAIVYVVYFVFSWHQSNDALSLLGSGAATAPLRRLLMPPWLYLRGMAMVAVTVSRPAYVLGHLHMHGVWYYFPVLFVLKSPLGFLTLLALAAILAMRWKRLKPAPAPLITTEVQTHWRVLWVSLIVLSFLCILSHLNVSFRHFSLPLVLSMLMLAPLPAMLQRFRVSAPPIARGSYGSGRRFCSRHALGGSSAVSVLHAVRQFVIAGPSGLRPDERFQRGLESGLARRCPVRATTWCSKTED